jgi:hypothetical protein
MVGARLALTDGSGPHLSWPPLSCGSEMYGSGTRDRTTDSPNVISRTGRRSRRRAQPGASPVTRQANCQYRAVRTSGHRTPSSPGNEKVGLTSAMWCQRAQTQPSRRVLNYAHTAYLCGIHRVTDGARTRDLRSHNPMLCLLSYGHQARNGFYQRKTAGQSSVRVWALVNRPSRGTRSFCPRVCLRRSRERAWTGSGS